MVGLLPKILHLRKSRRWSFDQIQAHQRRALVGLLQSAREGVPFYEEQSASNGDLGSWPILRKEDIRRCFPDGMVRRGVEWKNLYRTSTSGTLESLVVFQDEAKRDWDRAADLLLEWQGNRLGRKGFRVLIPPDACEERCGLEEDGRVAGISEALRGVLTLDEAQRNTSMRKIRATLMSSFVRKERIVKNVGAAGTGEAVHILDEKLEQIRSMSPVMLSGLPQTLHILARRAKEREEEDGSFEIPIIRPAGGKFFERQLKEVEEGFGGRVRENYGTAELGTIGFDCPSNRQQHLLSELFHLEFVRNGRPVGPGELGEILVTDLRNRVFPLIRYAVGDVGRYYEGPCACGFEGKLFSVEGRVPETIVTEGGEAFSGSQIMDALLTFPSLQAAKVLERRPGSLQVEMVVSGHGDAPTDAALSEVLIALLGEEVRVRGRVVSRISPEGSGKYRLIESGSYDRFHRECPQGGLLG